MREHFADDADIGIRGRGDTLDQAFSEAAWASTAAVIDPDQIGMYKMEDHVIRGFDRFAAPCAAQPAGLARKVVRLEPSIVVNG